MRARRQARALCVLKNQPGFHMRDFITRRKSLHRKFAQMLRVPYPDMHQKIGRSGNVVELDDLRQRQAMGAKGLDLGV